MSLAVTRELIEGPRALVLDRGLVSAGCGHWSTVPIFGRVDNSPHVTVIVERNSDKKVLAVVAQRQTICYARGRGPSARKIIQEQRSFERKCLRGAESAALRANHQSHALRRERMFPVQTSHGHRYLYPQSGAAPSRLRGEYFHLNYFAEMIATTTH
jgi:hypothetical protein